MRQIKFRAWDYYDKKMVDMPINHSGYTLNEVFENVVDEDRYGLMQFTGLLDKNGKEIYEGDIVEHNLLLSEVRWSDEWGTWEVYDNDMLGNHHKVLEVIGNIYENPELREDDHAAN